MILRPIAPAASHSSPVHPAWPVIEHTEKNCGRPCWVITQPDHAALSGAIAAALAPTVVESLSQEIIRGIALHDEGWASFDGPMPHCDDELISFFDVNADTAVSAWLGSIQRAVIEGPMAGAIVSRHFWRIASMRLEQGKDGPRELGLLQRFVAGEQSREERLVNGRWQQMEAFTDVLQFCDVLSLYLCCGATEDVTFPQQFRGVSPVLRRDHSGESGECAVCRFEPSPFRGPVDLGIAARRFPNGLSHQFAAVLY